MVIRFWNDVFSFLVSVKTGAEVLFWPKKEYINRGSLRFFQEDKYGQE
jgi:hypothetical protein